MTVAENEVMVMASGRRVRTVRCMTALHDQPFWTDHVLELVRAAVADLPEQDGTLRTNVGRLNPDGSWTVAVEYVEAVNRLRLYAADLLDIIDRQQTEIQLLSGVLDTGHRVDHQLDHHLDHRVGAR